MTRLLSPAECRLLAHDTAFRPQDFTLRSDDERALFRLEETVKTMVVLFDWTHAHPQGQVVLAVGDDGRASGEFLRRGADKLFHPAERLRFGLFRNKALCGWLLPKARAVVARSGIFSRETVGLTEVAWYDVLDRATGQYTEFNDFVHILCRLGRIPCASYYGVGPFRAATVLETFAAHPEIRALRVRQTEPQLGADGRRIEYVIQRA